MLVCLTFSTCKDDENNNIPLVEVNFSINIDNPEYIDLKTVGGWVEVSGGSRGIILYRANQDEIKAYDRHCTFQPSSTCALVSVDINNITASDQCCGSTFSIVNGSVTNPPASVSLKNYGTRLDGNVLFVFN
jgi:nitrite reductase/ring-hydroxylating ferredoxin subunit